MISAIRGPMLAEFLQRLKHAPSAALLIDYDGTLAPFHLDRMQARPYPGMLPLLQEIVDSGKTRVAVISGRPLRELKPLLDPLEGVEMWGVHGLQHLLPNGEYKEWAIPLETAELLSRAKEQIMQADLIALAEIKPGGIAMHWRGLPPQEAEQTEAAIREMWSTYAGMPSLRLLEFEQGLELRVAHPNKGDAVAAIAGESGPDAQIAYLGDDFTDEDAFQALNGSRPATGLSVLVRPEYRQTAAQAWLKPPEGLTGFLENWLIHTK